MKRILLTGAAGDIGGRLRKLLKPVYPSCGSANQGAGRLAPTNHSSPPTSPTRRGGKGRRRHRRHYPSRRLLGRGSLGDILQSNIIGCYNLFEAARRKGVKRVVFASTNHALGFYPRPTASAQPRTAPGLALRRQQGVWRSAGCPLRRQTRPARAGLASATSATSPSTSAGSRSGSSPKTWRS